jgi:DNA repair protein RadC
MKKPSIPIYTLRLVKGRSLALREPTASYGAQAARALQDLIGLTDREHLALLFLNARHAIVGAHIAAIGGASSIPGIEPRTLLRAAVVSCAAAIVIGHNHPSGDPAPSPEDHAFTRAFVTAAQAIGITVVDHIIVTRTARFHSMNDAGTLPANGSILVAS